MVVLCDAQAWRRLLVASSCVRPPLFRRFFFFNDPATTEIYTLSLHDALPIFARQCRRSDDPGPRHWPLQKRSEEHTSELQSPVHLVCRLLLEKKKYLSRFGGRRTERLPPRAPARPAPWRPPPCSQPRSPRQRA